MKYRHLLYAACLGFALLGAYNCTDEAAERAKLRAQLDEEFEHETEELVMKANQFSVKLNELIAQHEEMDKKHVKFDVNIIGEKIDPADKDLILKHEATEKIHQGAIGEAQDLVRAFNDRKEAHERMEASHGDVPLEELKKDHTEFEQDLKRFANSFEKLEQRLLQYLTEMKQILVEHQALETKYGEQLNKVKTAD